MKKFLKVFLIALLVIMICMVVFVGRKITILSKLDKSVANYEDTKDNIYIKLVNTGNEFNNATIETFIKGDIEKSIIKRNDKNISTIQFVYPTERKLYIDNEGKKVCSIQKETAPKRTTDISSAPSTHTVIVNFAHTMNFAEKILLALNTKIITTEFNGKQCYALSGTHSPAFIYNENSAGIIVYVEKDTGLPIKLVETINENGVTKEYITTYEVKFDCVTDEDMIEPNIEDYVLQENN